MQIMEATRMCRGTHAASWVLLFLLATVAPGQASGRAGALVDAVKQGDLEAVRVLAEAGADVASRDKFGTTPLQMAARGGHREIVRLLGQHGAKWDPSKTRGGAGSPVSSGGR